MGSVLSCPASADRLLDDAISGSLIYQCMGKVTEPLYLRMTHGINNDIHDSALTTVIAQTSVDHFSSPLGDTRVHAISTAL